MSLTLPLSYLFIPIALFALIYVIFFLINLYHLVVYTTPSLTGFIMTFFFFGRSSGRTLSFKEVWGVNKPWLVSVKTPYDKGRKRWGHGVGLSAHDAIGRAQRGANWDDILKYYYRGTELQKIY